MLSSLFACLFNVLSLILLVRTTIRDIKMRNGMLLYYCIICLYIVQIPLLYDSFSFLLVGEKVTKEILFDYNNTLTSSANYYILNAKLLFNTSLYILLSNIALILSYKSIVKKKVNFYQILSPSSFISNWIYLVIGIVALLIFIYYYGLDIYRIGVDYRNTMFGNKNPILSFIMHLCMISIISVVLKGLVCKSYVKSFILLLPMLLIGVLTVARALIISIPLMILYYVFIVNHNKNIFKVFIKIGIIGIVSVFILLLIRGADASFYPISRDISVFDYYYGVLYRGEIVTTNGYYFSNVLKIGIPFLDIPANFDTLESVLGDDRYFVGWGTLHPTLFGWSYIDAGWYGILICVFFGFFIGLTDIVRFNLPKKMSFLFLPFQLSFIAVIIRGSIQYAYGNIFYVFVFFVFCLLFIRLKKNFNFVNNKTTHDE